MAITPRHKQFTRSIKGLFPKLTNYSINKVVCHVQQSVKKSFVEFDNHFWIEMFENELLKHMCMDSILVIIVMVY
jgi:hypothetical protein